MLFQAPTCLSTVFPYLRRNRLRKNRILQRREIGRPPARESSKDVSGRSRGKPVIVCHYTI